MQSNTQVGDIALVGGDDLSAKNGYLAKIVSASGVPNAALPTAIDDVTPFVVTDGAVAGQPSGLRPIEPSRNVRLKLKGTCAPGDVLVAAVIAGADAGKVRKLPAAAGTYRGLAVAEETGAEGQLVLARPCALGNITVND